MGDVPRRGAGRLRRCAVARPGARAAAANSRSPAGPRCGVPSLSQRALAHRERSRPARCHADLVGCGERRIQRGIGEGQGTGCLDGRRCPPRNAYVVGFATAGGTHQRAGERCNGEARRSSARGSVLECLASPLGTAGQNEGRVPHGPGTDGGRRLPALGTGRRNGSCAPMEKGKGCWEPFNNHVQRLWLDLAHYETGNIDSAGTSSTESDL